MARAAFLSILLTFLFVAAALFPPPELATGTHRAIDLHAEAPALEARKAVPSGYVAPPYYPTPKGGWVTSWKDAYAKAQSVVSNMTLAEKVNITSGTGFSMGRCTGNTGSALRFRIPSLCLQDSALGVARTDHNTVFPAGITTGATFNKKLMYERGLALGEEARGKGVNIQLGPLVGPLGRKPRGGRNWEGFGADPVLQAAGGAETIKGMQANGVIATIKHFVGNEQEMYRMDVVPHGIMRALSSNIDDRTLHELYAWPFAEGIRAGVGAIMTSYNEVNGSACSQNSKLINEILKDEMGFQGLVMTDWLAQIGGVSSALSGNDMAMPGDRSVPFLGTKYWASELSTSVLNGNIPLERLNDMATRIVATWYQMGQDKDYPAPNFSANTADATGPCYAAGLFSPTCRCCQGCCKGGNNIAEECRQNTSSVNNVSLKVFGSDAQNNPKGPNACTDPDRSCNIGVLGMGWGSGTANYPYLDAPIDAIRRTASNVAYSSSDGFPSGVIAAADDIAMVFISSDSGENPPLGLKPGFEGNYGDRSASGLKAWHNGDALVKAAAGKYATVIVVVHTVGPILLEPWIDTVKAIIFAHLPRQEAGESLTDILFGKHSPSGHLPYSIPKAESDYPDSLSLRGFELFQVQDTFSEGLYIDYRYLNKHSITPRYAFGHGLSYTTFSKSDAVIKAVTHLEEFVPGRGPKGSTPVYSEAIPPALEVAWPKGLKWPHQRISQYLYPYLDLPQLISSKGKYNYPTGYQTTSQPDPPAGGDQGGNPALWDVMFCIDVKITNTGKVAGKEVVMVFVQYPQNIPWDTPVIQLRAFEKTATLTPGGSENVTLTITRKDISIWDVTRQDWVIPISSEPFLFWVGDGSANLTLACQGTDSEAECSGGRTPPV